LLLSITFPLLAHFSTAVLCFHTHSRIVRSISRSREVESRGSRSKNHVSGRRLIRRAACPVAGFLSRLPHSREPVRGGSSVDALYSQATALLVPDTWNAKPALLAPDTWDLAPETYF